MVSIFVQDRTSAVCWLGGHVDGLDVVLTITLQDLLYSLQVIYFKMWFITALGKKFELTVREKLNLWWKVQSVHLLTLMGRFKRK